jgi:hypothetical protein
VVGLAFSFGPDLFNILGTKRDEPVDFSDEKPLGFAKVLDVIVLFTGTPDIFHGIAEVEVHVFGDLDTFDAGRMRGVVGWMVDWIAVLSGFDEYCLRPEACDGFCYTRFKIGIKFFDFLKHIILLLSGRGCEPLPVGLVHVDLTYFLLHHPPSLFILPHLVDISTRCKYVDETLV